MNSMLKWNKTKLLMYLTVEDCPMLLEPVDGNMTCENITDGEICSITCSEGYRLPYGSANVYHCDETGSWSPAPQQLSCYGRFLILIRVLSTYNLSASNFYDMFYQASR